MDLSFAAVRVLVAVGNSPSGPSDQQGQLKAFNDFITSWPSRLIVTCLFVALAGLAYVLFRRAVSPAREALGAAIVAAAIFAVLPLLTTSTIVAYVMYLCLGPTWLFVLVRVALPRLGGLADRATELVDPRRRRERIASRRRSSLRGASLERTLETTLHEREAPRKQGDSADGQSS